MALRLSTNTLSPATPNAQARPRVRVHERVYRGFVIMRVVRVVHGVHHVRVETRGATRRRRRIGAERRRTGERGRRTVFRSACSRRTKPSRGERHGVATAGNRLEHASNDSGATLAPVISSTPPLSAYSNNFGRLHRAPKYAVFSQTKTAHATADAVIAAWKRATHQRVVLAWIELVPTETDAANARNEEGSASSQRTVMQLRRGAEVHERLQETPRRRGDEMRGKRTARRLPPHLGTAPAETTRGPHMDRRRKSRRTLWV